MESFISKDLIIFPSEEEVRVWNSLDELMADIKAGNIPVTPKRKRPLLTDDLPDLEFWVGKKVGFGRPLFKKFWSALKSHVNPVGSWIGRLGESEDDDVVMLRSPQAGEGGEILSSMFRRKVFNYPKPPTLIEHLLRQTARVDDTVLDFFAGSGTTAHAVLKLNKADQGRRRFIMVSSTEATPDKPERNICRDVMSGYAGEPALPGSFAYGRIRKVDPVDFEFDLTPEQAWNTLTLFHTGTVMDYEPNAVNIIERTEDGVTAFCASVTEDSLAVIRALPERKVRVYSDRPETVAEALEEMSRTVESLSVTESVRMI